MKVVPESMHRAGWATVGVVGIVAVLVMGFGVFPGLAGSFAGPASMGHPIAGEGGASPLTAPASARSGASGGPISASVVITTGNLTGASYTPPIAINYTITLVNATISPANVTVSIAVYGGTPARETSNGSGAPIVAGTANYTAMLDYYALGANNPLPTGNYTFIVWVTAVNSANPAVRAVTVQSNPAHLPNTVVVDNPTLLFSTPVPVYAALPLTVNFNATLNASNSGIVPDAANLTAGISFWYTEGSCSGPGCAAYVPVLLYNSTLPYSSSGQYSASINSTGLSIIGYNGGVYPVGVYTVQIYLTAIDSANSSFPSRTVIVDATVNLAPDTPVVSVVSPLNTTTGLYVDENVSITAYYDVDYASGANVSVINQATNSSVFVQGVFAPGAGGHATTVVWVPASPGKYAIVVAVDTPYSSPITAMVGGLTIAAASSLTAYHNTTTWHNGSYLLGIHNVPAAAAVLVVIGLIIGMIVALALGRMMWAGSGPKPAQPWSSSQTTTTTTTAGATAAAVDCPVCHQSFPDAGQLSEHQKQAHGMS